jgi:serine/threonine-protein kinase
VGLEAGAVVAGRYRVDRRIASGGMGEVWTGEHVAVGMRVALKTLLPAARADRQLVARFRREAQLLGRVRSERVSRVVDFVDDATYGLVLVMDFVEGEPLGTLLAERRLDVEDAIALGVDLARALADLHGARVVHRDLKPDNVILEALPSGRRRAVVLDLGVGRLDDASPRHTAQGAQGPHGVDDPIASLTEADMAVGTLAYMAPEQLLSSSTATAAADQYALGAILYRAVSGGEVFRAGDEASAAKEKLTNEAPKLVLARVDRVANGLCAVVARALRRLPEERFASADAMLADLAELADLARATSLDLEAATEEALPPSSALIADDPTDRSPHHSTERSPALEGEPTRRMSQPPVPLESAPFSRADPPRTDPSRAEPTRSRPPSARSPEETPPGFDPLTASSIHQTRPTVHSPILAPVKPPSPPTLASLPASTRSYLPPPRALPIPAAVIGMLLALLVGAIGGFATRALTVPAPPHAHH